MRGTCMSPYVPTSPRTGPLVDWHHRQANTSLSGHEACRDPSWGSRRDGAITSLSPAVSSLWDSSLFCTDTSQLFPQGQGQGAMANHS